MAEYLVAIYLPDDFDPSSVDKAMERDIDALNAELDAKGVRIPSQIMFTAPAAGEQKPMFKETA